MESSLGRNGTYTGLAAGFSEITKKRCQELADALNAVLYRKIKKASEHEYCRENCFNEKKGDASVAKEKASFRVAVIGSLKTGKSALINALLGEKVLPSSVLPCTEVMTEVKYGDRNKAVLRFLNPLPDNIRLTGINDNVLAHMYQNNMTNVPPLEIWLPELGKCIVCSDIDPEAGMKVNPVTRADVFLRSTVLENGSVLIDYPGLKFELSDKKRILSQLKKVNLILFVMNAATPCTNAEMEWLREIKSMGLSHLVAINRFDQIKGQSSANNLAFICSRLKEKLKEQADISEEDVFFVSAKNALDSKESGNNRLYLESGIPTLYRMLMKKHHPAADDSNSQSRSASPLIQNLHKKYAAAVDADAQNKSQSPLIQNLHKRYAAAVEACSTGEHKKTRLRASKNQNPEDHIAFADSLIQKYKWPQGVKKSLLDRLNRIKEKQQDHTLSLSIIGEFSVGKSTFINGLLRSELLESSTVQGTTVAATVIEYNKNRTVLISNKKGRTQRFLVNNDSELRMYVKTYTTDPSYGKSVDSLTVGMPNPNLKQGVRIIDTPGTNALEAWHEETTIRAIRDLSDASIILIDATKPLPKSQKAFIHNYLEELLPQCVYVVTKIDLVRERERQEVLEYIRQQISYEFDIDDPFVVPYASLDVLEAALSDESVEDVKTKRVLDASYKSEAELFQYVEAHKSDTLANKLSLLLEEMYSMIGKNMKQISDDYQKEHNLLAKTKRTDLNSFVSKQTQQKRSAFRDRAGQIKYRINEQSESLVEKYKEEVLSELDGYNTKDGIRSFVNDRFAKACKERSNRLANSLPKKCKKLEDEATFQVELFRTAFKQEYERLGLLPMDHSKLGTKLSVSGINSIVASTGNANQSISEASWDNIKAVGGGAAAGAVIGTFFGPGIGTAIGAAIGGWLFSPGVDRIKQEAKSSLKNPMDEYFEKVLSAQNQSLNEYSMQLDRYIGNEIDKHFAEYNAFVQKAVMEDEKKKKQIEEKIKDIRDDMAEIDLVQKILEQFRMSFR